MAYLREIVNKCDHPYCDKKALVEVVDRWNGSRGKFCRKHGNDRLKEVIRLTESG